MWDVAAWPWRLFHILLSVVTVNQSLFLVAAVLIPLCGVFVGLGVHLAIDKAFGLIDGHLERFQAKLDVLVTVQTKNNAKLDAILRKLL